jgi:hypothetical protein
MAWVHTECPRCGEEVRVEVMSGPGGYPGEEIVEVTDIEYPCMCDLTDKEIDALYDYACEHVEFIPMEDY